MMNARTAVAAAANHQTGTDDDFKLNLLLALERISGLRLSSLSGILSVILPSTIMCARDTLVPGGAEAEAIPKLSC